MILITYWSTLVFSATKFFRICLRICIGSSLCYIHSSNLDCISPMLPPVFAILLPGDGFDIHVVMLCRSCSCCFTFTYFWKRSDMVCYWHVQFIFYKSFVFTDLVSSRSWPRNHRYLLLLCCCLQTVAVVFKPLLFCSFCTRLIELLCVFGICVSFLTS